MKKFITILIILAVLAGGVYAFRQVQANKQAQTLQSFKTEIAQRGPLISTIGATGSVRSNQTAFLNWQTSGTVERVPVAIGDSVQAGQTLATLEQTSLPQNVILAQADLVSAQKALDDLTTPPTELQLAQAQQAIAAAKKAVDQAQRTYNSYFFAAKQADIDSAEAQVVLAQDQVKKAQENYDKVKNRKDDDPLKAAFKKKLADAQLAYDRAKQNLNWLTGSASQIDIDKAAADLELAKAQLTDAQDNYQKLLDGPDPQDVSAAEARIAAIQATLNYAQITAPFDAVVTEINIKPGDQAAPGTVAFRLDDLNHLLVDVDISEADINNVQIGQEVSLLFDAVLSNQYHGAVVAVGQVGTIVQGVVNFKVTVEITDADALVKPGMTAAVTVVVDQLEDVLLVPNRAVRIRNGKRVVYVLPKAGQMPEAVEITLGASADLYSQVIDGNLKEGDKIVLNPPAPSIFSQGGPGGGQ